MPNTKQFDIPITKPVFGPEELQAVQRPLQSGWVVQGPFVKEFETLFAAFVKASSATAVSSCTAALHIAMAALKLKPGDEVMVPAFTWVSSANAVEYMGAKPVFCDINPKTFNIDVDQLKSLIGPRTVGIMAVHLFGLCADMNPIIELAKKHGLWVVEDAACAVGAWYHGRHAGTLGDIGCFSFHPRKSITTGEGGMLTSCQSGNDAVFRSLREHGASRSDLGRHEASGAFMLSEYNCLGYNYRMTDIQAALGCAQMARLASILEGRTVRAHKYDKALAQIEWLEAPAVPPQYVHGYQAYVTMFRPEQISWNNVDRLHRHRNNLMGRLEGIGISTRQGTHAPVILGYYRDKYGLRREDFPNAYFADRLSLTLPLYVQMTDVEQQAVLENLKL